MPSAVPVYAADFPLEKIPGQLCDDGPYKCPTCEAQCAFGLRFLEEIDSAPKRGKPYNIPGVRPPVGQSLAAQRRVYDALMDLENGSTWEEVWNRYGYANKRRMKAAIKKHKEEALARFGNGKAPG